jgi:hypothetical protein
MNAGDIVSLTTDVEAKFVKAGTAEYMNQQPKAEAKKKPTDKDKAPIKPDEFSREELDELATFMKVDSPEKLGDKAAVIKAIKDSFTKVAKLAEAKPADAGTNASADLQQSAAITEADGSQTAGDNTAEEKAAGETQQQTTAEEKPIGRSSKAK